MAKSNRFFSFTLFLLATAIVTSALEPELAEETDIAPEAEDFALPPESDVIDHDDYYEDKAAITPEPQSEKLKFLNECVSKITAECAKEVFNYMFQDLTVTEECCAELVKMGEPCHIGLVKTIFSFPEYKANASLGIPRSKRVWDKCALVVGASAYSTIPYEI